MNSFKILLKNFTKQLLKIRVIKCLFFFTWLPCFHKPNLNMAYLHENTYQSDKKTPKHIQAYGFNILMEIRLVPLLLRKRRALIFLLHLRSVFYIVSRLFFFSDVLNIF